MEKQGNNVNGKKKSYSTRKKHKYQQKTCSNFVCSKWCLYIYVFLLSLIGILLLAVGSYAETLRRKYDSLNEFLSSPAIFLIVIGVVVFVIALVGILGVVFERYIVLKVFLVSLILILVVQITCGIVAFVYREKAAAIVGGQMTFAIKAYKDDDQMTRVIDHMQRTLECCGFTSYNDWEENKYYSCNASMKAKEKHPDLPCSVPESCCKKTLVVNETRPFCSFNARSLNNRLELDGSHFIVLGGCSYAFIEWIGRHLDVVGGVVMGFALPQVIGIFLTFWYIVHVEDRRHLYKATHV